MTAKRTGRPYRPQRKPKGLRQRDLMLWLVAIVSHRETWLDINSVILTAPYSHSGHIIIKRHWAYTPLLTQWPPVRADLNTRLKKKLYRTCSNINCRKLVAENLFTVSNLGRGIDQGGRRFFKVTSQLQWRHPPLKLLPPSLESFAPCWRFCGDPPTAATRSFFPS